MANKKINGGIEISNDLTVSGKINPNANDYGIKAPNNADVASDATINATIAIDASLITLDATKAATLFTDYYLSLSLSDFTDQTKLAGTKFFNFANIASRMTIVNAEVNLLFVATNDNIKCATFVYEYNSVKYLVTFYIAKTPSLIFMSCMPIPVTIAQNALVNNYY